MKRPRGVDRDAQVRELRTEAPFVRHAWELGRIRRRVEADLKAILDGTLHTRFVPIRAGDPRIAHAQVDRHLQAKLRANGSSDEHGLIYGGERLVAYRPFVDTTVSALRDAGRALDQAFLHARFSSVLEHIAFSHAPKHIDDDRGPSTDAQWHDAWFRITFGRYTKAAACEAINLDEHAYDERRRRPKSKSGGLSDKDAELIEWLREQIVEETNRIENHREYREYVAALATQHGLKLPKELRIPGFSKALRKRLPADWRFMDDDRLRWKANLSQQPRSTQATWRRLIELREAFLAAAVAALKIGAWIEASRDR